MEERKLTLRNHLELIASDLSEAGTKLESLVADINNVKNEWIDDDILGDVIDLLGDVLNAADKAWGLENRLQDCDMGKWRF